MALSADMLDATRMVMSGSQEKSALLALSPELSSGLRNLICKASRSRSWLFFKELW